MLKKSNKKRKKERREQLNQKSNPPMISAKTVLQKTTKRKITNGQTES